MIEHDHNWVALQKEKQTYASEYVEQTNMIGLEAEKFKLTLWYNNPNQLKLEWRQGVVKHTAWVYRNYDPGSWRTAENRIWDELRTELRHEHDLAVRKFTAKQVDADHNLVIQDLKLIALEQHNRLGPMLLIINQPRKLVAEPSGNTDTITWIFKEPK